MRPANEHPLYYPEPILCRVVGVSPFSTQTQSNSLVPANTISCDVEALDGRGRWTAVPVATAPGLWRCPRIHQAVIVQFMYGVHRRPVITHILHNDERPSAGSKATIYTPVPIGPPNPGQQAYFQNDDLVLHHYETGAFLRFANVQSTPSLLAGPGGAAHFELTFTSGAKLRFDEVPTSPPPSPSSTPTAAPSPPTQCSCSLTMPSGAQINIDVNGNVTVTSPKTIILSSNDVELSGNTNKAQANGIVRYKDLQAVVQMINSHVHSGVQTGTGQTAPPTSQAQTNASTNSFTQ